MAGMSSCSKTGGAARSIHSLDVGVMKPESSALIGAWPPALSWSQPVKQLSTARCWHCQSIMLGELK
eukprot:6174413-Pleurochrysis_carterae.AAC.1